MKKLLVALIGNPNAGKTTIFNHLTGFRQKVANYPGVTVEKKIGTKKFNDTTIEIVDLPGIYSLSTHSEDEQITKNFILDEKPDIIINIVDASNLDKSLLLTTELMETGRPILLALNMIDRATKNNQTIDVKFLEKLLEVETVPVVAIKKKGLDELIKKAYQISKRKTLSFGVNVKFDQPIENEIKKIENLYLDPIEINEKRLIALKLLQEDEHFLKKIRSKDLLKQVHLSREILQSYFKDHLEIIFSKKRYEFIDSILEKALVKKNHYQKTRSDKIDEVLTHKFFGLPIFLLIMYLIFQFTFSIGAYPMGWIESGFSALTTIISNLWPASSFTLFRSLIIDGVIAGVGSVVIFMPNILILFFCISILEDSGYMARAALILDRFMHKIGLHGKSFIPMLIGFGCSVPAIMATRFMESKKDRYITILTVPLIACSAKLVVFTLLIPVFFPKPYQSIVLFALYLIGIVLAIIVIKIFKLTLFKGKPFSFVMELPSYKMPSFFTTIIHMWGHSKEYIKKAATLILGFSIIIWAFSSFPLKEKDISKTYMGKIGKSIEPIFKPLGFDWKIDTALISSIAAKEVFITQVGVVYAIKGSKDTLVLQDNLKKDYSPLQAFCIMLFVLISTPCIATIAITKKETGSYKWAFFQFFYLSALAYIVTLIVYQVGSIFVGGLNG
ncbi:MAG: Ferrous iron transport protein B [Candidatus Anoxychlamydiales bacterium]|nr:Ferrous iron transport protein B [Candidatus Anoxychlamydiales bacterium]